MSSQPSEFADESLHASGVEKPRFVTVDGIDIQTLQGKSVWFRWEVGGIDCWLPVDVQSVGWDEFDIAGNCSIKDWPLHGTHVPQTMLL